jgi:hypothetical protein
MVRILAQSRNEIGGIGVPRRALRVVALRMPLFMGRCRNSSEAHLLGFLIGRFACWPIMIYIRLPLALTLQIVDSALLHDVGVGPCSIYFHSIIVPTSHHDTFKSICCSADVTDFRRASDRAGPHDDYQSSLCLP